MSSCLYDEFYVYVMMQSLYHESMSTQLVQFSSMIQVYDMRTSLYQESKSIPWDQLYTISQSLYHVSKSILKKTKGIVNSEVKKGHLEVQYIQNSP